MADASSFFLLTNNGIMTSTLFLKIIFVLANFLDFIRDLTINFMHSSLFVYFEENVDSIIKFNKMPS